MASKKMQELQKFKKAIKINNFIKSLETNSKMSGKASLRPNGDQIAADISGTEWQSLYMDYNDAKELFDSCQDSCKESDKKKKKDCIIDILCDDGHHYHGKIISLTKNKKSRIQFLGYSSRNDCEDPIGKLYIAQVGTFTIIPVKKEYTDTENEVNSKEQNSQEIGSGDSRRDTTINIPKAKSGGVTAKAALRKLSSNG
jgi:hypothetical protein